MINRLKMSTLVILELSYYIVIFFFYLLILFILNFYSTGISYNFIILSKYNEVTKYNTI